MPPPRPRTAASGWLACVVWAVACAPVGGARPALGTEPDRTERGPVDLDERAARLRALEPSRFIPIEVDDATFGEPTAPVTLVLFMDLACDYCRAAHATVAELGRRYGGDVLRGVFKHAPLRRHPRALPAARAAQTVLLRAGDAAFFDFVGRAYAGTLDDETLLANARAVGVRVDSVTDLVGGDASLRQVEGDLALADALSVRGVPSFRINGWRLSGAEPIERFTQLIDHELQAAEILLRDGVPPEAIYALRVAQNLSPEDARHAGIDTGVYAIPIENSPVRGPADALVTIVEFSEFECPFCARVQPTLQTIAERYPGDVRFVFKHNPLPFHRRAIPAAMLVEEARARGGDAAFFSASAALFDHGRLEEADLRRIARSIGLDVDATIAAVSARAHIAVVERDQELARTFDARGTPHFFINGRRLAGARELGEFVDVIEERLEHARRVLARSGAPRTEAYRLVMAGAQGPAPPERRIAPGPDGDTPSRGPVDAPVLIQMFSDFECRYCGRVMPTLSELEREFPGQLRVVWRHMPLAFHRRARLAANAAMEARAQLGDPGFWGMGERLFSADPDGDRLSMLSLERHARALGLDMRRFQSALVTLPYNGAIERDLEIAREAGIDGTPAFLVNGYFVSGARPLAEFRQLVQLSLEELERTNH